MIFLRNAFELHIDCRVILSKAFFIYIGISLLLLYTLQIVEFDWRLFPLTSLLGTLSNTLVPF